MKMLFRLLLLGLLISTSVSVLAQESITFIPYSSEGFGFESVVPDGWVEVGQGAFARRSSGTDSAIIVQQSAPASADDVLGSLLPRMNLTEAPESVGTYSGAVEWTLYKIDIEAANISVDLALSESDGSTYLVLMQASPDEYDALHESVFLPMLDAFTPLEATEEPDVPYDAEEVTFEDGDVTLAGTLTLPPTEGPHPVIVLVTGSGPQDRDETLGGGIAIKPFKLLADGLTRAGVAVLRYDDRGVGKSTGDYDTSIIPDFASDAEAAINYLLTRDDINPDKIGLLGHSEGGLVAAMLGARNKDLDFIITLGGPGVNGHDLLIVQNQRLMQAEGVPQEQIDSQVAFVEALTAVLDNPQEIEDLTYQHTLEQLEALPEDQRARPFSMQSTRVVYSLIQNQNWYIASSFTLRMHVCNLDIAGIINQLY